MPLPAPLVAIVVRPLTASDIEAVDALQKRHGKQLGFMNRPTLEGKVALGHVLVAEAGAGQIAGYLIGNDRYKHRDELGVIFQLWVAPKFRRSLVAANLLRARFERSAYGCRLYCCWCAQDIEANRFWESMGFVPIAFRGSATKDRVHIVWQKRIRAGDETTPWWFPSETSGRQQVNAGSYVLEARSKYDVSRSLEGEAVPPRGPVLLPRAVSRIASALPAPVAA